MVPQPAPRGRPAAPACRPGEGFRAGARWPEWNSAPQTRASALEGASSVGRAAPGHSPAGV